MVSAVRTSLSSTFLYEAKRSIGRRNQITQFQSLNLILGCVLKVDSNLIVSVLIKTIGV